jgi:Domain of unknown function (DUF4625)
MKSIIKFLSVVIFPISIFSACQKNDSVTADPSKVTIAVLSPDSTHLYHKGDTINISANVTYISELHGYSLEIKDSMDNTVYSSDIDIHQDHFSITEKWVDTISTAKKLTLYLHVEIDHNGNEASKTVTILTTP